MILNFSVFFVGRRYRNGDMRRTRIRAESLSMRMQGLEPKQEKARMKPKLQHHAVNKKGQCGFKRNLENASSLKDQEFDSFFPPPHLRTFKVPAHARRTTSASACLPYRTETERCENFQKHIHSSKSRSPGM